VIVNFHARCSYKFSENRHFVNSMVDVVTDIIGCIYTNIQNVYLKIVLS